MMRPADLISPEYVDLQRELHAAPSGYGGKGSKWADTVCAVRERYDAGSVLDYGCGRGSLALALYERGVVCREYDPAVAGKDGRPGFADLVVCTDVLEHIEPERLIAVLTHIGQLARKAIFLVIALVPANKVLSDGRNAHLILESAEWWADRLREQGWTLDSMDGLPYPRKMGPDSFQKRAVFVVRPA